MNKKKKEPRVKSVMTPFPHSVWIKAPILVARAQMVEHNIRHLPVTESHKLCGIVTDRDLKLLLGPEVGAPNSGGLSSQLTVEDAYVEDCYVVDLETPLAAVLEEMASRHIGAALVTARGKLAGIFTATDACRVFAAHLQEQYAPLPDDAA
ncbi:MAG: CBS domain-containing protein [Pseudomonadales bacterium]